MSETIDLFTGMDRAETAIARLREFCPPEGFYVAFSGGKDSIVLLDLVRRSGVKHDAHYNITGVDPPELVQFIHRHYPDVERHRPEKTMWKLIVEKMMPPTRIVRYCCEWLKERGGEGRTVATGVRWAESVKRSRRRLYEVCTRSKTKKYFHPIIDWTDAEVWGYIREHSLQYCVLYDEGFTRLGCVGCPMAGDKRIAEFRRWPQLERAYRRAFAAAAANRLRLGNKYGLPGTKHERKLRWEDGDAMFDWWMKEKRAAKDAPGQGCFFFE